MDAYPNSDLCMCGCGRRVSEGRRWIVGHHSRRLRQPTERPSLSDLDLGWVVGMYEGEGSISASSTGSRTPNASFALVVSQKDTWVLERLSTLLGGSVRGKDKNHSCSTWTLCGGRARGLMEVMWPYLSPRRRQQVLDKGADLWLTLPEVEEAA